MSDHQVIISHVYLCVSMMTAMTQGEIHRSVCTQKFLHTDVFAQKSFYTQTRLHTQKALHREALTQRSFCTQMRLHTEALHREDFTQRSFYTGAFTQRSLCAQKLLHREVFEMVLHTEKFLHRGSLYIEKSLHRGAFTRRLRTNSHFRHGLSKPIALTCCEAWTAALFLLDGTAEARRVQQMLDSPWCWCSYKAISYHGINGKKKSKRLLGVWQVCKNSCCTVLQCQIRSHVDVLTQARV